jgi:hypothetical protein
LLSNKKSLWVLVLLSLTLFSCSKKKEEKPKPAKDYDNPQVVDTEAKKYLGNDVAFAYKGSFDGDNKIEIAAGKGEENKNFSGIKFYLLKQGEQDTFAVSFESDLLNGSFRQSLTKKIKFPQYNYELLYYNSQDYYLGSGGGEIYSYIVDFSLREVYSAHLVIEKGGTDLYLSKNIHDPELKNFYISYFKKDYPNLKLLSKDISFSD